MNWTRYVWHVLMNMLSYYTFYGYHCRGDINWYKGNRFHARHFILDPYSKLISPLISIQDNSMSPTNFLGWLIKEPSFDLDEDSHLFLPLERLGVYRLDVEDVDIEIVEVVVGSLMFEFFVTAINVPMVSPEVLSKLSPI